jgi:tetratricopeptide (TPR) repeat protein
MHLHDVTDQVELDDLRADVNRRAAALFAVIDDYEETAFLARIDALAAELPAGDADGLFHRACARDSLGHSDLAVPLYREALDRGGLTGENRRRAVIQMSSSLRNLGEAATALAMLEAERARGSDHLDDALDAVTALCLASLGREREGLSLALIALAKHLPRYNRSMANYGKALLRGVVG